MNFTPTYGWYYINANNKSPSWTGVPYFYNFMTRNENTEGPVAVDSSIDLVQAGDAVQLSFEGAEWNHTPFIVAVTSHEPNGIFVAAHSYDADYRPLSSYNYAKIRFLHFVGVRRQEDSGL